MNTKMKLVLLSALTVLASAQSSEACIPSQDPSGPVARCLKSGMKAQILKADRIARAHSILHSVVGSVLTIDSFNKKITLPMYCPPNAMCVQMTGLEFVLVSAKRLDNGAIRYEGIQNPFGPVGVSTQITITDYSKMNIEIGTPAPTIIEYTTKAISPRARAVKSVLFAEQLAPIYVM